MLRNGLGCLFVAGVLVSAGLALNCNQCTDGFLKTSRMLSDCLPSTAVNVTCPTGTEYCLKTDGAYNWSYSTQASGASGTSSGGSFYDCGTPALIQLLFGRIPPASDNYCDDNIKMFGQVLGRTQWFGLNGTVCICKGVTCNSGNTISAGAVMLTIPLVVLMIFMK
ncbi:uncharacterized protein LOC129602289 [Paramacrobiotus metropolitanus]|uniref:uncharacterized protein LOC129602289 n=1 Tax=Paramacrobiotus metropolitanus TaxID=2943436 RepID=UPI00244650D7|nr:uncharacterized protein LOC129602289 [Paramacrobiotus metropolitanus]